MMQHPARDRTRRVRVPLDYDEADAIVAALRSHADDPRDEPEEAEILSALADRIEETANRTYDAYADAWHDYHYAGGPRPDDDHEEPAR